MLNRHLIVTGVFIVAAGLSFHFQLLRATVITGISSTTINAAPSSVRPLATTFSTTPNRTNATPLLKAITTYYVGHRSGIPSSCIHALNSLVTSLAKYYKAVDLTTSDVTNYNDSIVPYAASAQKMNSSIVKG
ncbi:MAG: hypothetical protein QG604_787 [Candidatus Dependentiae bacterium]|nr:hypothetical protein [Candidatus Dependentiae bacterium]